MSKSKVYFTKDITPEALIKIYEALKEEFTKNRVKQENVNKEKEL